MTRAEHHRQHIQSIIDNLTAEDQIRRDAREGLHPDHMCNAVSHLREAKRALLAAEQDREHDTTPNFAPDIDQIDRAVRQGIIDKSTANDIASKH